MGKPIIFWSLIIAFSLGFCHGLPSDVTTIPADLITPIPTEGTPKPGKRVLQQLSSYKGTQVFHALYLPTNWDRSKSYPVLAEFNGNGGNVKSGQACQGYGISGGEDFIWVTLPFISEDGLQDMTWWWGDPDATAKYAIEVIEDLCETWGGDSSSVILTGYSRGAIACNYIGLRNDQISKLWKGMVPASHYDNRKWKMDNHEYAERITRLKRLKHIPQYVCGEHHLAQNHNDKKLMELIHRMKLGTFEKAYLQLNMLPMTEQEGIRQFIQKYHPTANITFSDFPWVNHTGEWILRDTLERRKLRNWVTELLDTQP